MKLSGNDQQESYENAKNCYVCKDKFEDKYTKEKTFCKVRDHWHYVREYRDAAHRICNWK